MTPGLIFNIQLVLGYVAWLLCFTAYLWPRLRTMDVADASRVIAALHSFRFFGLVFILPGLLGPAIPSSFAVPAAWGDLAAGVLAMLALMSFGRRFLFWFFVAAFNVVGALDLLMNYVHAVRIGLPEVSGQLGLTYLIPILYVPILMITHGAAFVLMTRSASRSLSGATHG
ncbi:MAG TPA: hypothetical protein VFL74_04485 [Sphingomicrobium sp.]|nr:hypothetical protein [Sphingomicrobium sp.]